MHLSKAILCTLNTINDIYDLAKKSNDIVVGGIGSYDERRD